ncbi:MAG TPA: hypothetical protein VGF93_03075 [Solirubrobacteraceae bacterium]|jgi:hypothetical protein
MQDRLDVLYHEIELLQAARDELQSSAPGPVQSTPSKPRTVRRRRRTKPNRQAAVLAAGQVEGLLAEHSDITSSELAKLANGGRDQVLTLLRELETAGRARRTGQRRGTRWHAVTDEDRINARAAELEKQSKRAKERPRAR